MWEEKDRASVGYNEDMFEGDAPSDEAPQAAPAQSDDQALALPPASSCSGRAGR